MPDQKVYDELLDESLGPADPTKTSTIEGTYSSIFADEDKRQEAALRQAQSQATSTPADQAAEAQRVAKRLGLPVDVVERNLPAMRERARVADTDYARLMRESPIVASWLTEENNSKLSQDELPALGALEQSLRFGRRAAGAFGAGAMGMSKGFWGLVQAGAEAAPDGLGLVSARGWRDLAEFSRQTAGDVSTMQTGMRGDTFGAGSLETGVLGGIESLGQTASSLPLLFVPGGQAVAAAAFTGTLGASTAGQAYDDARRAGVAPNQALVYAYGQGGVEVLTELIPAKWLLGDLAKNAGLGRMLLHQIAGELPGEQVATVFQDLNEWAVLHPEKPFSAYLQERPSAAAQTFIATLVAVGGQTAAVRVLDRATSGKPTTQRTLEDAGAAAAKAATTASTPEKLVELVGRMAPPGSSIETTYLPVDTFVSYYQDRGVEPATIAEALTGNPAALGESLTTGADLAVPTARYLEIIGRTEHNAYFAREARFSPDELNAREEEILIQAQGARAAIADLGPEDARTPYVAQIRESVRSQLVDAGIDKRAAGAYADLHAAAFATLATRAEVDPEVLFDRYRLAITREAGPQTGQAGATQRARTVTALDLNRAIRQTRERRGESPRTTEPTEPTLEGLQPGAPGAPEPGQGPAPEGGVATSQGPPAGEPGAPGGEPLPPTGEPGGPGAGELGVEPPRPSGSSDFAWLSAPGGVPRSVAPRGESGASRLRRRQRHYSALVRALLKAARQVDPIANLQAVRNELTFRIEAFEERQGAYLESGQDPLDLLREIAAMGGLNTTDKSYPGELRWLQHGLKFGSVAGVPGVFKRDGLSVDDVVTGLNRQEQRFAWVTDIGTLIDAIDDAVRHPVEQEEDRFPGTDDLKEDLGIDPETAWWKRPWMDTGVAPEPALELDEDIAGDLADYDPGQGGDVSFDPAEFEELGQGERPAPHMMTLEEALGMALPPVFEVQGAADAIVEGPEPLPPPRVEAREALARVKALAPRPDVSPDSRAVPFETVPDDIGTTLFRARDKSTTYQNRLPVDRLIATQATISEREVVRKLEEPVGKVIEVLEHRGRYYIADGTHTSTAAWARGDKLITATITQVNEAWLEAPPPYRSALEPVPPAPIAVVAARPEELYQADQVEDYGGQHRPPGPDDGAPAWDLTGSGRIYPEDVYSGQGVQFYGTGDRTLDRETFKILNALKGKPDAKVRIYRSVPVDVDQTRINAGDWVSVNRKYAEDHGLRFAETGGEGEAFKILEQEVTAREIFTNGDSIHEWGYWPAGETGAAAYDLEPGQLVHGSPKVLTELQPGSMLSNQPEWAAGYTTRVADDLSETFVGQVHVARIPEGPTISVSTLHGAEEKLLAMGAGFLGRPAATLQEAAQAVAQNTDLVAIVSGPKANPNGAILLRPAPVERTVDPRAALLEAKRRGLRISDNMRLALGEELGQPAGEVPPPPELTAESLEAWTDQVRQALGLELLDVRLSNRFAGNLILEGIAAKKAQTGQGAGTRAMQALTALADQHGKTIELSLALPGYQPTRGSAKTSGKGRLVEFYKRFGFVENKGRRHDAALSLYTSMYRRPGQGEAPARGVNSEGFLEWFGDSQVVDEEGRPAVVYHGTNQPVRRFDLSRASFQTGNPNAQLGFFFTRGPSEASRYAEKFRGERGGNVIPVFLAIKNAYRMPYREFDALAMAEFNANYKDKVGPPSAAEITANRDAAYQAGQKRRAELIAEGYDGIVVNEGKGTEEWIAFHPEQIRSRFTPGEALAQPKKGGGQRGVIRIGKDRTMAIALFASADLSTFLHESGHFFLEVFADTAQALQMLDPSGLTPSQRGILADYGATLQRYGVQSFTDLTEEHKEDWARSFEAYLFEGKAPSPELRSMFSRFSAWLRGIYRSLRGLRVQLTPEVRGVFDRLLATDAAIASAQAEARLGPLFLTQESSGMTVEEWEAYQDGVAKAREEAETKLRVELLGDYKRAREQWWKEERARTREEVAKRHGEDQVYVALSAIRTGLRPDGTPFIPGAPVAPLKLNKAEVERLVPGATKKLPRPYVYTTEGGIHPDDAAELLAYDNGQALIEALILSDPFEKVVDLETDRIMEDRYGDKLAAGQLEALARDAVESNAQADLLEAEQRALARKRRQVAPFVAAEAAKGERALEEERAERDYERRWLEAEAALRLAIAQGRKQAEIDELRRRAEQTKDQARAGVRAVAASVPSVKALRAIAQARVSQTKIGELKPLTFWHAAKRAGTQAIDAAARQEWDRAVEAKGRQRLNLELYRAAQDAVDLVEEGREEAKALFRADATLAKSRNMDYVAAARILAARYFFPTRQESALEAIERLRTYDPDLYANLEAQIAGALAGAGDLKALTVENFVGVKDTIAALWALSRRDRQVEIEGKLLEREAVMGELAGRLQAVGLPTERPGYTQAATKWEQSRMYLMGIRSALRRVEHWVDAVDQGNLAGPFRKYVWSPISEAAAAYRQAKVGVLERYLEIVKAIEKTLKPGQIAAPEIGYTFSGRAELLHALLHTGNASNLQKLLRGRKWGEYTGEGDAQVLDTSRWDRFVERAQREGVLTRADYEYLQATWDLLETLKAPAQKAHRAMYGTYFSEIVAVPLVTPFGTFRGGYVPAIADPFLAPDAATKGEKASLTEGQNSFMFPTTGRGFTKARTEAYAKPLALNLALIPQHIDKVLRFVHLEPVVKDVGRMVFDPGLRATLDAFDPTVAGDLLVPWLQRSASQRVQTPSQGWGGRAADTFFRGVRTRVGLNIMTANVVNVLQQFTGFSISATQVRKRYLVRALWRYVRNPVTYAEEVARDPWMATRVSASVMEVQSTIDDLLLNPSKYDQARAFASRHGYFLQAGAQNVIDVITYGAAYEEAIEERGVDELEARRAGGAAVRLTQGSFAPEDVSRFETGTPFMRAFSMFFSYFNNQANLLGSKFAIIVRDDVGLRKGAGRALYLYTFGFMIPAVLSEVIRQGVGGFEGDDDESYLEELLALFFGSQARAATAFVPILGPTLQASINAFNDRGWDDRISTSPAVSTLEQSARAPKSVYDAIAEGRGYKKAIRDVLTVVGLMTGLPVAPLGKPLGYAADVAEGRTNPEGPVEIAQGLVSGRSPR